VEKGCSSANKELGDSKFRRWVTDVDCWDARGVSGRKWSSTLEGIVGELEAMVI